MSVIHADDAEAVELLAVAEHVIDKTATLLATGRRKPKMPVWGSSPVQETVEDDPLEV